MNTVHTVAQLRAALARARQEGKRIGLVPTMGNLHEGHIALVEMALQRTDHVVVSIFVNPLQFGPNEDLDSYPRTLAEDQRRLLDAGAHTVFAPSVRSIWRAWAFPPPMIWSPSRASSVRIVQSKPCVSGWP